MTSPVRKRRDESRRRLAAADASEIIAQARALQCDSQAHRGDAWGDCTTDDPVGGRADRSCRSWPLGHPARQAPRAGPPVDGRHRQR